MARHKRDYSGELRSVKVTVQLTPSERAAFEEAAKASSARSLSEHARDLCLRRTSPTGPSSGSTRPARNAQAAALAKELLDIGHNLNQLTRRAHIDQATPQIEDLKATTAQIKAALARVLAL